MATDRRRGALRIALASGATFFFVLAVSLFFGEWHRVERDPGFCAASCHHEPRAGHAADLHAGGHSGIACQDCHTTPLGAGLRLLGASLGMAAKPVAHGGVSASTCAGCHAKRPEEWRLIAETKGHRAHIDAPKVDCLSCHASTAHVAQPEPAVAARPCLACHDDQRLHKQAAGADTCLSCHGFAVSPKNVELPTNVTCTRCHDSASHLEASVAGAPVRAMKPIGEHALHAGVACQLCHNPHGIERKVPPGQPSCAACHQLAVSQVGSRSAVGPDEHRRCEGCHEQHAPRETALERCVDCHEKNARGLLGAAPGSTTTTTALRHANCASCHVPHTWKAEPSGCVTCHAEQAELLRTRSPPQHTACADCHDVHGPPPTGAICTKCHSEAKGTHVALAPDRHKDCTSCHNPHAPRPEDTRGSCAKCHTAESSQLAAGGPAPRGHGKDGCETCHQPHGNPLPRAGLCEGCHAGQAKAVAEAEPPKHRVCASCHEKHVFRISEVEATCEKCHEGLFDAATKHVARVPHQEDCANCHAFHGSPQVAPSRCLTCHDDVARAFRPPNARHATCDSCHLSHTPASAAPAQCPTCHADKAAIAARWPAASPHATDCTGCHRPHEAQSEKPCAACHANEAASATGGKHECKQCHPPHVEPPGTGVAWWSRCGSCHEKKVESAKARGPTHAECKNCHQPHGFGVPSCTGCHNDMGSKGLHAVSQHAATCTSCHDPHVEAPPTREQCLACHKDRRAHEPNAKNCFACHLFRN